MIFVDSSAWFAVAYEGDRHNALAKTLIIEAVSAPIVTSDHVLVETWLLINSRFGHNRAEQFWRRARTSRIKLEIITRDDIEAAWLVGQTFQDQTFSLIDRTSFVVMERLGITRVISFDTRSEVMKWVVNPALASMIPARTMQLVDSLRRTMLDGTFQPQYPARPKEAK